MSDQHLKRKMQIKYRYLLVIIIIMLIIMSLFFYSHLMQDKRPTSTFFVKVVKVKIQPMPVTIEAPAIVESIQSVPILPQITGILKRIYIEEGEFVKAGQLLFEIDPAPFIAQLQQAEANLRRDQITLLQNQRDAQRNKELAKLEYVTKQISEQAQTIANAQAALVAADLAQVKQAKINLDYTKIRSPLTGKAGDIPVQEGDVVSATTTNLVTINQLNPVRININLPQNQLQTVLSYQGKKPLVVNVLSEDGEATLAQAKVFFIDNTVNPQTGTFLIKAETQNSELKLWPGQMLNVQVVITIDPRAMVIPMSALMQDQQGNFVYTVVSNKAIVRRVIVSRQVKEEVVIAKGLQGSEKVITTVPPNLIDDAPVSIINDTSHDNQKSQS